MFLTLLLTIGIKSLCVGKEARLGGERCFT